MARNSEKQYGRLNRLLLCKEKEEYEKNHPKRPNLKFLDTVEEIQKWLPSIKQDMDFYLKKSEVICYSDEHIEECKLKVISLEKEYKSFVRKLHQLTPGTLSAVPWTNRSYTRKSDDSFLPQPVTATEFKPISTPVLDQEIIPTEDKISIPVDSLPFMDQPLTFITDKKKTENLEPDTFINDKKKTENFEPLTFITDKKKTENLEPETFCDTTLKHTLNESILSNSQEPPVKKAKPSLVNYTYSSDSDS